MKLIVGLGNPGVRYKNNRHNVGFVVIDKLSQILNSKSQVLHKSQIQVFKSKNFMNESGDFVRKLTNDYHLTTDDLFVVHDDLDIKLGEYKIQFGKGPKGHNGLISIYEKLGTKDFWHVRVGVDNRIMNNELRVGGEDYVLGDFEKDEKLILEKTVDQICKTLVIY